MENRIESNEFYEKEIERIAAEMEESVKLKTDDQSLADLEALASRVELGDIFEAVSILMSNEEFCKRTNAGNLFSLMTYLDDGFGVLINEIRSLRAKQ